jgi:hypothetical protein
MRRAVVCLVFIAACQSSSAPRADAPGDYTLMTINGHPLPATGGSSMVLSSSISLRSDGHFSLARIDSFPLTPGAANDTLSLDGTWSLSGTDLRMFYGSGQSLLAEFFGTLSGSQLTIAQPSEGVWVYTRR